MRSHATPIPSICADRSFAPAIHICANVTATALMTASLLIMMTMSGRVTVYVVAEVHNTLHTVHSHNGSSVQPAGCSQRLVRHRLSICLTHWTLDVVLSAVTNTTFTFHVIPERMNRVRFGRAVLRLLLRLQLCITPIHRLPSMPNVWGAVQAMAYNVTFIFVDGNLCCAFACRSLLFVLNEEA